MSLSTHKKIKFKDYRNYEVTEDEYIQILDMEGRNTVMWIDGSIGKTLKEILNHYFNITEILSTDTLNLKK